MHCIAIVGWHCVVVVVAVENGWRSFRVAVGLVQRVTRWRSLRVAVRLVSGVITAVTAEWIHVAMAVLATSNYLCRAY